MVKLRFMAQALELAKKGRYSCSPNPMVGCVITNGDTIIGEGWHHCAGEQHAEIAAIQSCQRPVENSTLYVTLEPCCHIGRTGSCVKAIIDAGISTVIVGSQDPNPKVAGKGIVQLRQADINVEVLPVEDQCMSLNRYFFHAMRQQKPYVIAKWAMSIDGKIATKDGDSRWISNQQSRAMVHETRHRVDAIVVGAGTVIKDNPRLTCRKEGVKDIEQPVRIILDGKQQLSRSATIFCPSLAGKTVLASELMQDTSYQLSALLDKLHQLEIRSVLVEGGSKVLTEFLQQDLVDEIQCYIAPKLIGGEHALTPFSGLGFVSIAEKPQFSLHSCQQYNDDVLMIYRKGDS